MKLLCFVCALWASHAVAAEIWPDASAFVAAEYPATAVKKIKLITGTWIDCAFEITTKGNGCVALPGVSIRVYDSHDDGLIYRNGLLQCEWRREAAYLEFVVSGVAEKTSGSRESIAVRAVFRYESVTHRFKVVECSPEIYFWRTPETKPQQ